MNASGNTSAASAISDAQSSEKRLIIEQMFMDARLRRQRFSGILTRSGAQVNVTAVQAWGLASSAHN